MLLSAVGDFLPVAMAVSLTPIPIIGVVLVLGAPDGRAAGPAFALGWVVALALLTTLMLLAVTEAGATSRSADAWLEIAVGLALIAAAVRKWRRRSRAGAAPKVPRWMASLDTVTPRRAMIVGAALGGANPKSVALAFAGAAAIVHHGLGGAGAAIAVAVFVLLGSVGILGAVLARLSDSQRAIRSLEAVKQFLIANNDAIMMTLFLLIGVKVLGDGLAGL